MSAPRIAEIKALIRTLKRDDLRDLVEQALACATVDDVRDLLKKSNHTGEK
jgi:phosphoenolpyruvate-protein kinase (PTS system EI component)